MKNNLKAAMAALKGTKFDSNSFYRELSIILQTFKGSSTELLDGDGVDELTKLLNNRLNLLEGNITNSEFDQLEKQTN